MSSAILGAAPSTCFESLEKEDEPAKSRRKPARLSGAPTQRAISVATRSGSASGQTDPEDTSGDRADELGGNREARSRVFPAPPGRLPLRDCSLGRTYKHIAHLAAPG